MNFRLMPYAFLLPVVVLATSATPGAALPTAPSSLAHAVAATDLRTDAAARRTNVVRNKNMNVNRTRNVNVNRNRDVNVNVNRRVVVRPVRPWVARPWFGTVVAGVTIGTVIAATTVPPAPASNLCWFWSDSSNTRGYWDYCTPPR